MAQWVKCTRKGDEKPIYLNLDAVLFLRWIEAESFTLVLLPGGKENIVRVLEHPDVILGGSDYESMPDKTGRKVSR